MTAPRFYRFSWFVLSCSIAAQGCGDDGTSHRASKVAALEDRVAAAFEASDEPVPVIVSLRVSVPKSAVVQHADAIVRLQDDLEARLGAGFSASRRYRHVAAIAGRISREAFESLREDPSVASIALDGVGRGQLREAVPAIGGDKVESLYGLTGQGVRVAVLDTGIDTDHPDLRDSLVAQHCFTQAGCGGFSSESSTAEDDHGHGSNVTGVITSNGDVSPPGFAPDAEIVAIRINANDVGQESDWVAGLDWVYDNLSTLEVDIVNLSIGTDEMHRDGPECDSRHPAMARAIENLVNAGVTVFAASGNRGSANMLPAPACITGVITVGATYDSNVGRQPPGAATYADRWGSSFGRCGDDTTAFDQITCFTNSTQRLDLVAPGAPILSDSLRGSTELYWGTSQACPAAAGVAALMLQCNPDLTPAQIKDAMVRTGIPRVDSKNGLSFPSLRALEAVQAVCFGKDAGSADASAEPEGGAPDASSEPAPRRDAAVGAEEAGPPGGGTGSNSRDAGGDDGDEDDEDDENDEAFPTTPGYARADADCACSAPGVSGSGRARLGWLAGLVLLSARVLGRRRRIGG